MKPIARKEVFDFKREGNVDIKTSYINTILGQRNLLPLTPDICPQFNGYSSSLELFSLPDYLVLCDNLLEMDLVNVKQCGVKVVTVSSFEKFGKYAKIDVSSVEREFESKSYFGN